MSGIDVRVSLFEGTGIAVPLGVGFDELVFGTEIGWDWERRLRLAR